MRVRRRKTAKSPLSVHAKAKTRSECETRVLPPELQSRLVRRVCTFPRVLEFYPLALRAPFPSTLCICVSRRVLERSGTSRFRSARRVDARTRRLVSSTSRPLDCKSVNATVRRVPLTSSATALCTNHITIGHLSSRAVQRVGFDHVRQTVQHAFQHHQHDGGRSGCPGRTGGRPECGSHHPGAALHVRLWVWRPRWCRAAPASTETSWTRAGTGRPGFRRPA